MIEEAILPDGDGLSDIDRATMDGAMGMLDLVYYHISKLESDWDHIEEAVQALQVLRERIGEDTK